MAMATELPECQNIYGYIPVRKKIGKDDAIRMCDLAIVKETRKLN